MHYESSIKIFPSNPFRIFVISTEGGAQKNEMELCLLLNIKQQLFEVLNGTTHLAYTDLFSQCDMNNSERSGYRRIMTRSGNGC